MTDENSAAGLVDHFTKIELQWEGSRHELFAAHVAAAVAIGYDDGLREDALIEKLLQTGNQAMAAYKMTRLLSQVREMTR